MMPVIAVWSAWAALMTALCVSTFFESTVGGVHLPYMVCYFLPVVVLMSLFLASARLREWMLGLDTRLLMVAHCGRFAAFGFLMLTAYGLTSAKWAIPTALGDLISAMALPTLAVIGFRRGSLSRSVIRFWNVFGLLDFVQAFTLIVLLLPSPIGLLAGPSAPTNASLVLTFPLNVIPIVFVPILFSAHLVALLQLRGKPENVVFD